MSHVGILTQCYISHDKGKSLADFIWDSIESWRKRYPVDPEAAILSTKHQEHSQALHDEFDGLRIEFDQYVQPHECRLYPVPEAS